MLDACRLVDQAIRDQSAFASAMTTAHNGGGPPEDHPYGHLLPEAT